MDESELQRRRLLFRFSRTDESTTSVPASLLIQTLEGAQRALWLIALSEQNRDVKSRARIPAEIERQFQLRCEPATPGSYVQPAYVESLQPYFGPEEPVQAVVSVFQRVGSALADSDGGAVAALIRDASIRRRVVDAFQQLGPKPGTGWHLELGIAGKSIMLGDDWNRKLRALSAPPAVEPDLETINGDLVEIHFGKRQFAIIPKGTSRTLSITYPDDLEDLLVQSRRACVQVTGRVIRDELGDLKDIFEVEQIAPLDLSPIELFEVEHSGLKLRFRNPVLLQPRLSEDHPQFINVEDPNLGIDVFVGRASDLMDEIAEDLAMLWRGYARVEDRALAPRALALKQRLIEAIEEVPIGG